MHLCKEIECRYIWYISNGNSFIIEWDYELYAFGDESGRALYLTPCMLEICHDFCRLLSFRKLVSGIKSSYQIQYTVKPV